MKRAIVLIVAMLFASPVALAQPSKTRAAKVLAKPAKAAVAKADKAKTDKDNRADFLDGYDFDEAFRKPFLPKGKTAKAPGTPALPPNPKD